MELQFKGQFLQLSLGSKTVLSSARVCVNDSQSPCIGRFSRFEEQRAGHARAGEVQFLALATRGQAVTATGLEDGPVRDWLVVAMGGVEGECGALGDGPCTDT